MKHKPIFTLHLGVDFDPLKYQKQPLVYYFGTSNLSVAVTKLRQGIYQEVMDI